MQQFFLFFTMLITASQAFVKQSHGRQLYKSMKKKSSEFGPNVIPSRSMFSDLNLPAFFMPFAFESADLEPVFFVPLPRFSFKPRRRKNVYLQRINRFKNGKTFKRKLSKKRDLDVFNSGQCFHNGYFRHFRVKPHCNFTRFPGGVLTSRRIMIRNPKQYIVYLYPVFNHLRKRTNTFLKKRKFYNLKKQYLNNLKNKKKRSASITTEEASSKEKKPNPEEKSFNEVKNLHTRKFPHSSSDQNFRKTSLTNEFRNGKTKNYDGNFYFRLPSVEYHYDSGHDFDYNLQFPEEDNFAPSPLDGTTDLYVPYTDVTPASVTLPEVTFKYPYNPKLYEASLRNDDNIILNPVKKKLETDAVPEETETEKMETTATTAAPGDFGKLTQMLEEVESLLKGQPDDKVEFASGKEMKKKLEEDKDKDKDKEKDNNKKDKEDKKEIRNDTIVLKEKIDKVVIPLLTQISHELGKMKGSSAECNCNTTQSDGRKTSQAANIRCSPDGTWTSSVFGVEMTFTTMPNLMLKVDITPTVNPIINNRWAIHGLTLSKHGGPLMLAAVYPQKRKIASFIGQCKICKDQDLIFGSWTIFTCVRKFTDLWKTVETKLDVLKKKTSSMDKRGKKKFKDCRKKI